jgi:hypothetical protein
MQLSKGSMSLIQVLRGIEEMMMMMMMMMMGELNQSEECTVQQNLKSIGHHDSLDKEKQFGSRKHKQVVLRKT